MRCLPVLLCLFAASGAAVAQPAPSGEGRIIVFFAWDEPTIDRDAAAELDALAATAVASPHVRLTLTGHADRSGSDASNRRAGLKRAGAVRAYLHARGVPEAAMVVRSAGETQPLIPTADGVREPQNRRVEVAMTRTAGD